MAADTDKLWTYLLTNGSLTIVNSMGLRIMCMTLITTGTATYIGTAKIGGLDSVALTFEEDIPVVLRDDTAIDGVTIIADASSTIEIVAYR